MRTLYIVTFVLGFWPYAMSQSDVKLKLKSNETIKGEWLGMEDGQYMVDMDEEGVLLIPHEMVYKLRIKRPPQDYPRYDNNRNAVFYGISGDFTTTVGQANQNFQGLGIKGTLGYDWNHDYALKISAGYRNLNLGNPETFIPVSITPVKYLTRGRYLLYGGLEAAYNWGIENPWKTGTIHTNPWISSWQPWPGSRHTNGQGPSVTPLLGVRMIGKDGVDHEMSIGLHFQKFASERELEDDIYSRVELTYRRWQISYGIVF